MTLLIYFTSTGDGPDPPAPAVDTPVAFYVPFNVSTPVENGYRSDVLSTYRETSVTGAVIVED